MVLRLTPGDTDTEVGKEAFRGLNCIHTVILPASIERIGVTAFAF